ncbi:MAG: hypothetical protein QOD58_1890 [Mycobacterium sp.]|nr:hypothetical protein [Mycobacterium sp.]
MYQYQGAKFCRDGKEAVQARVGQFGIPDSRADLDTEESRLAHAPAQLFDGPVGVLKGDGAQCGETTGVLVDDPGEEIVLSRRQFGRTHRVRVIAERHRNRRKHLHGNAVTVHVDDPVLR